MVLLVFVRVKPLPWMIAVPPELLSVTVPPPCRLVLAPRIRTALTAFPPLSVIAPAFEIVPPLTVKEVRLPKLRLSSASTVRLLAVAPLMSRVTADAFALPLSIKAFWVLDGGAPRLHMPPLLQFPAPPSQLSF